MAAVFVVLVVLAAGFFATVFLAAVDFAAVDFFAAGFFAAVFVVLVAMYVLRNTIKAVCLLMDGDACRLL